MASIEVRELPLSITYRVCWREDGAKQYESFSAARDDRTGTRKARADAEEFKRHVEVDGKGRNRWPRGWTPGVGWDVEDETVPRLRDYAAKTLAARSKADEHTRHGYETMLRLHINPVIGHKRLNAVTRFDVIAVADALRAKGRAPKTIANVHAFLSSILDDAMSKDRLIDFNPAKGALDAPPATGDEMVFLTHAEFALLAAQLEEGMPRDLITLLVGTGMRWGEATALQVRDVDGSTLRVRRAWKRRKNSWELGEPKTRRSRRDLDLSPKQDALLKRYVRGKLPTAMLFTLPDGSPVRHANFYLRQWAPAVFAARCCDTCRPALMADFAAWERAWRANYKRKVKREIPRPEPCQHAGALQKRPRIHDLRHTHISWLIDAGINLAEIQRRAGHESIQTTVDRYGHPRGAAEAITAAVDAALG